MRDRYLIDRDYIRIKNLNMISYGGNQKWCTGSVMKKCGCGVIAMADVSIYLAEQNPMLMTEDIRYISKPVGLYNKNDYMEYVKKFYLKYVTVLLGRGLTGLGLMCSMNRYFISQGMKLRATWKLMLSDDSMLEAIDRQLTRDIPVIISIGPNTPNIWGKKGVSLYACQDGELTEPHKCDVKAHYVVVTGIRNIDKRPFLVISSWGRKYLLDYGEYREYAAKTGGRLTTSMLEIRKKY